MLCIDYRYYRYYQTTLMVVIELIELIEQVRRDGSTNDGCCSVVVVDTKRLCKTHHNTHDVAIPNCHSRTIGRMVAKGHRPNRG